jgi:hypothetical protein
MRTPAGRTGGLSAAVVMVALVSACGITHSPLEVALGDASSAAGAAAVAVRALGDGDVTTTVAQTAVDDAVTQASQAAADVAGYRAEAGLERRLQQRAVEVVARTTRHLHRAQDDLTKASERRRLERVLKRDRDQLDRLSTSAGEVR